jgi:hypothetical protein
MVESTTMIARDHFTLTQPCNRWAVGPFINTQTMRDELIDSHQRSPDRSVWYQILPFHDIGREKTNTNPVGLSSLAKDPYNRYQSRRSSMKHTRNHRWLRRPQPHWSETHLQKNSHEKIISYGRHRWKIEMSPRGGVNRHFKNNYKFGLKECGIKLTFIFKCKT